jgi:hypothetical protein
MAGRDMRRASVAPPVLLADRTLTVFVLVFFPRGLRVSELLFGMQIGNRIILALAAAS